jgi:hypothetical protein
MYVSTPEYCTVLNTLFAIARNSQLRVSPRSIVFDSDMLFDTVPGPAIELRGTLPNAFPYTSVEGNVKAVELNHFRSDPPPSVGDIGGTT